jgi:phenylacetate-CoA ligase
MGYRIKRLQDVARGIRASKEMVERERWPSERLERFRQDRLERLTRHAAAHSRLWRERLPVGSPVRLAEVPVLTKPELMDRFDDLVTDPRLRLEDLLAHLDEIEDDALYLGEHRVMTSSGSSGRKAVYVYDRPAWSRIAGMFLRRSAWTNTGPRFPRLRLAMIGGGSPTHMTRRGAQTMDVGMHRLCRLSVTQPVPQLVEQQAGRLRIRPESLFTSSEPLSPTVRERLQHAFGVRPYDFYATTEGLFGHECPEGSMHLFDDMCIAENVDEDYRPVPPGEVGASRARAGAR